MTSSSNPLISVIVPIYNVEKYLLDCLNSLSQQTFNSFEVILVDDGSTDGSGRIAQNYSLSQTNFKYFKKSNGGLSSARNFGILNSKGKYLAFIDSDDYVANDFLQKLYEKINHENCDIAICGYTEFTDNRVIGFDIPNDNINVFNKYSIWEYYLDNKNICFITAWSKLYKRELFNNLKFDNGKLFEDELIVHKLFDQCERICCISEPLYFYRRGRKDSITAKDYIKLLEKFEYIFNRSCFFLENEYPLHIVLPYVKWAIVLFSNECCFSKNQEIKQMFYYIKKIVFCKKIKLSINQKIRMSAPFLVSFFIKIKKYFNHLRRAKLSRGILKKYNNKNWFVGSPNHGNLGDQAIAQTTVEFLGKNFLEIDAADFMANFDIYSKCSPNKIVLIGGGNLGNVYTYEEELRYKVISTFPEAKIIVFPQTIWFEQNHNIKYSSNNISLIYDSHPNLTLFARERYSFDMMNSIFKNAKIKLCPDTVFIKKPNSNSHKESKKVLFIMRNDRERDLDQNKDFSFIKTQLESLGYTITVTDTVIKKNVDRHNRKQLLSRFYKRLRGYDFVVTDRLHGMIFSFINSVPVIVLNNYNHKINGSYDWIRDNKYVCLGKLCNIDTFVCGASDSPKKFCFNFDLFHELSETVS